MADRFHGTLYVSNSEMHGDTDWVRASDYDAAHARIRELEAAIKAAIENEVSLDSERGSTWHILNDALASQS